MNQKLKKIITFLLIYASSILLAIILADGIGLLYTLMFNSECANSLFIMMNFNQGCKIEGFIYAYGFLLPFISFLSLKRKIALLNYFFGIALFVILSLFLHDYLSIVLYICLFIISFGLSHIVNKVKMKTVK